MKNTCYKDKNGKEIFVGDTLFCDWGYSIIVYEMDGDFVGKLICKPDHPCRDIPYHLNNGISEIVSNGGNESDVKKVFPIYPPKKTAIEELAELKKEKGIEGMSFTLMPNSTGSGEDVAKELIKMIKAFENGDFKEITHEVI